MVRGRAIDLFLTVCFAAFAIGSAMADIPVAFGAEISPTSPNPLGRMVYDWAVNCDPITLQRPAFMRVIALFSTFFFVPFYPVLAYALVKRREWIRVPALAFVAAITATNAIYFGVAFFGEPALRCQNPAKFLGTNLPYLIVPWLLAVRVARARPKDAVTSRWAS
jgi:hypothetical protein